MKTKFKWLCGFIAIMGIFGFVFRQINILYYLIILLTCLLASYFITEAKNKKKTDLFKISIVIGSIAIILPVTILIITGTMSNILAVIILIGILAFMVSFFSFVGMEEPEDERLRKIGTIAATYSWFLTLLIIGAVLVSTIFSGSSYVTIENLGLVFIIMIVSMLAVNIYFLRRGDIEY